MCRRRRYSRDWSTLVSTRGLSRDLLSSRASQTVRRLFGSAASRDTGQRRGRRGSRWGSPCWRNPWSWRVLEGTKWRLRSSRRSQRRRTWILRWRVLAPAKSSGRSRAPCRLWRCGCSFGRVLCRGSWWSCGECRVLWSSERHRTSGWLVE